MYRFHPGVKDACKQKIFHSEAKSHPGANNAYKLPLRVDAIQKEYIYHTKQDQTCYIKCD